MFKKIQDWIFKEDLEELDIDEKNEYEEEIVFAKEPIIREEKRKVEPVVQTRVEVRDKATTPKMNIDIKVDDPIKEKKIVDKRQEKTRATLVRREDYEMPPVISPYFGVKGEKKNEKEDVKPNQYINNESRKETFNSVISPFYGKTQSQKPIQETRFESTSTFNMNQNETLMDSNAVESVESDEDNLSLDEIVSTNVENTDDLIQFSLFGENKKIQDDEFENEDNDNDDSLPF